MSDKHHSGRVANNRKALAKRLYGQFHPLNKETFTSCSCWMCGNPRKFMKGREKITMQERKENEKEKYDRT
jgi:hypothetical protein